VAKCHGPRSGGGPLGPPAPELKILKIYLYAKYNYIKYIFIILLFNGNFYAFCHEFMKAP
jgi:hypothetical protein